MLTKKKPGRPEKSKKEKVKTRYIYLSDAQHDRIKKGFKTLTMAVLSKCG